jgi:hypothetical protein
MSEREMVEVECISQWCSCRHLGLYILIERQYLASFYLLLSFPYCQRVIFISICDIFHWIDRKGMDHTSTISVVIILLHDCQGNATYSDLGQCLGKT